MKKIIFYNFVTLLIFFISSETSLAAYWFKDYYHPFYSGLGVKHVATYTTDDGGYLSAGALGGFGSNEITMPFLLKLDGCGNDIWQKFYDNGKIVNNIAAQKTGDGNFLFFGDSRPSPPMSFNSNFLLKVDEKGTILWQKKYFYSSSSYSDERLKLHDVRQALDGGYIASGWLSYDTFTHTEKFDFLVKLDPSGATEWTVAFELWNESITIGEIVVLSNGDYIADMWSPDGTFIVRLDSQGGIIWQKQVSTESTFYLKSMVPADDNAIMIGGNGFSSEGLPKIWLAKINNLGEISWQKEYGGSFESELYGAIKPTDDEDEGYIVAGSIYDEDLELNLGWWFEIDGDGNILSQRILNPDVCEQLNFVKKTQTCDLLVSCDLWGGLMLLDSSGTIPNMVGVDLWDGVDFCDISQPTSTVALAAQLTLQDSSLTLGDNPPSFSVAEGEFLLKWPMFATYIYCENEDNDNDTIPYYEDNCPTVYNPDQADSDDDGYGDACDAEAEIEILSPDNNTKTTDASLVLSGMAYNSVRVEVNGIEATIEDNRFFATVPLVEGSNTITAVAYNAEGLFSTSTITVIKTDAYYLSPVAGTEGTNRSPYGVAVDNGGNVYVADAHLHQVYKVSPDGTSTVVAGLDDQDNPSNNRGYAGDGGPATLAKLDTPSGVDVDVAGNIYIVDRGNYVIRKVEATYPHIITTIAGKAGEICDESPFDHDVPATEARLYVPRKVAVDSAGNVFISMNRYLDGYNHAWVVKVGAQSGLLENFFGSSCWAVVGNNCYQEYEGISIDSQNAVYTTNTEYYNFKKINADGDLVGLYDGFWNPFGVAVDDAGNIFVTDTKRNTIKKIDPNDYRSTIAGNGQEGTEEAWGLATQVALYRPADIVVDSAGIIYFTSSSRVGNNDNFNKVYKLTPALPSTCLSGTVVAQTAEPVVGALVTVTSNGFTCTALTDASGMFSVCGFSQGAYTLRVEAGDYLAETISGVIDPGQSIDVNIALYAEGSAPALLIQITSPENNAEVLTPVLVVGQINRAAVVTVNNVPAQMQNYSFSAEVDLVEGLNTIIVTALDAYSNTAEESIELQIAPSPFVIISASPLIIEPGQSSLLSWESSFATACSIEPDVGAAVDLAGSVSVSPAQETIYTITATNDAGVSTQASVTVQLNLDADGDGSDYPDDNCPGLYNPGQVDCDDDSYGDACDNCPYNYNPLQRNADDDTSGDICDTTPGCDAGECETVSVPTLTFLALPRTIERGGSATLHWTATGVDECLLDGAELQDLEGNPRLSGQITFTPFSETTTFVMEVTNTTTGETLARAVKVTVLDVVEEDRDYDGVPDSIDICPDVSNGPLQGKCFDVFEGVRSGCTEESTLFMCGEHSSTSWCETTQFDYDEDGLGNVCDNCWTEPNSDQSDGDGDGRGDVCDPDWENDGVENEEDNCPTQYNPDQLNSDGDDYGDECDNCKYVYNPEQGNGDNDKIGDLCEDPATPGCGGCGVACEIATTEPTLTFYAVPRQIERGQETTTLTWQATNVDLCMLDGGAVTCDDGFMQVAPLDTTVYEMTATDTVTGETLTRAVKVTVIDVVDVDSDNDGVSDVTDNCPTKYNPDQLNSDGDDYGDECDNCKYVYNPEQGNGDNDKIGDLCEDPATPGCGGCGVACEIATTEPTLTFYAVPRQIERCQGTTTLTWQANNVDSCMLDGEPVTCDNGSMQISPLDSTVYEMTATDGTETLTRSVTVTVTESISAVTIDYPVHNQFIERSTTLVRGGVDQDLLTGDDIGVTVNGVVANVLCTFGECEFAANNVSLFDGDNNTLSVFAVNDAGDNATACIGVAADTEAEHIRLDTNVLQGLATCNATISVDIPFRLDNQDISFNASPETDLSEAIDLIDNTIVLEEDNETTSGALTVGLSDPDLYYFTVSGDITLDNGTQIHHFDSISLLVEDMDELDIKLNTKWGGMKSGLSTSDKGAALNMIACNAKEKYDEIFTDLAPYLPEIVTEFQNNEIEMIYQYNNFAKYRINRVHNIDGQDVTITYYIYFVKDADGVWRIESF